MRLVLALLVLVSAPLCASALVVPYPPAVVLPVLSDGQYVPHALERGAKGVGVSDLQLLLSIVVSDFPGTLVTGYFGPRTQLAVEQFQKQEGIATFGTPKTTGFGRVGPVTGKRLLVRALEKVCSPTMTDRERCLRALYAEVATKRGTTIALALLRVQMGAERTFGEECHQVMHEVGHVASREWKTLGNAFIVGNSDCQNGFYHGVVEEFVGTRPIATFSDDEVRALCRGVSRDTILSLSCAHGLGHAFIYNDRDDIVGGLSRCGVLSADPLRGECIAGVFMQYGFVLAAQNGEVLSTSTKSEVFRCTNTVADNASCWLMLAREEIKSRGGDVRAFCGRIDDEELRAQCGATSSR